MTTVLAEESKRVERILADIKTNNALLAACDSHLFEFIQNSRAGESQYLCRHCGGKVTARDAQWYMVGLAHGNKFSEDKQELLHAKQEQLERQYDILSHFGAGTPKEIAVHLALFAQAWVFNAAAARIVELQQRVDDYARRVTVQDTEIAILRQREEMTR